MATTPVFAFPYPGTGDPPNGPVQIGALAQAVEDKIVAMEVGTDVQYRASAAVLTTSATYVNLTGDPGGSFVAPASGRVWVHISSSVVGDVAGTYCRAAFQIRTGGTVGSGTIVYAVSDDDSVGLNSTADSEFGRTSLVTGLTPGSTYNVQMLYKRAAGAGQAFFARRSVGVAAAS